MGTIPKVPVTRKGIRIGSPFLFLPSLFTCLPLMHLVNLELNYFISHAPPAQASSPANVVSSSVSIILVKSISAKSFSISV